MNAKIELAKELKKFKNPKEEGNIIGEVISEFPIIIKINDKAVLHSEQLIVTDKLYDEKNEKYKLKIGNYVMLLPIVKGRLWVCIDKVIKRGM